MYRLIVEGRRRQEGGNGFIHTIKTGHFYDIRGWQQPPAALPHGIYLFWRWFARQWTDGSRYFWPIFFILFGYTVIIYGLYYFFSEHIKLSEVLHITNWDNLRSLGLTFASHIAVPFAAIGYFLSSRRTQAMQKGNDIQSSMQVSTLFIDSQRMIDAKGVAAIGAISVLVRLGKENDDLRDACKSQLIACLETYARKDGDGQRPDGDQFLHHIEAALNGLCALHSLVTINSYEYRTANHTELVNLDFSNVRLQSQSRVTSFTFKSCAFNLATLNDIAFDRTYFLNCDFSSASLAYCEFLGGPIVFEGSLDGSTFTDSNISGTNFQGICRFAHRQLARCRYLVHAPPTGLKRSAYPAQDQKLVLPTPWDPGDVMNNLDEGEYLTMERAQELWSSASDGTWPRPRDRNGNLIEIIDPYKDDSA
ncbi:MAG: pentapeptide repeat-containing protein [Alphaproteobacteria bacterium]|nr:pentapeptide repeat-containing protein [Alphaproteobacteria bacterium]